MSQMKPSTPDARRLVHDGALALAEVEANGMRIDTARLDETIRRTSKQITKLESQLKEGEEWKVWRKRFGGKASLGSRQQLAEVLKLMDHKTKGKTRTGRSRMDQEALERLDIPIVKTYVEVEKLKKLRSTYLKGVKRETVDGFLHPSFNLHLARTFRSSSDHPNFQNIPIRDKQIGKLIRRCFIPREGHEWVSVDFCLAGDTLVETIDGQKAISDVVERTNCGEDVWVYGYDQDKGRVGVGKVSRGGCTRKNAEVVRVVLDNGESVVSTTDHQFLLRDGTRRCASKLSEGDSLMPFYKENKSSYYKTVYTRIYLNNGKWEGAHNLIAEDVWGIRIRGSGLLVHHWDGNGTNNSLDNLDVVSRPLHMRLHAKQGWKSETGRRKHLEWCKSEQNRENMRRLGKRVWTEEERCKLSESMKDSVRIRGGYVGPLNPMFGRKHTAEARAKQSARKVGKIPQAAGWNRGLTKETSESVRKISDAKLGRPAWNKGRRKPPVELGCEWCGCLFKVPYVSATRSFCSRTCAAYSREAAKQKNHKVVRVEAVANQDVFNITVEGLHSFALSAGVVVSNCALEFRIAACFWRDDAMVTYASDPDLDIHRDMAAECYMIEPEDVPKQVRFYAKNQFVFPTLYGSYYVNTARNLWNTIGMAGLTLNDGTPLEQHLMRNGIKQLGRCNPREKPTKGTFEQHVKGVEEHFHRRFPQWSKRREAWWKQYEKQGWFRMMTGFVCSGIYSHNDIYNYPIQGPAFHCLLWSLIQLVREMKQKKMRSLVIGQIHDSIEADVHKDERTDYLRMIKRIMTEDIREAWPWIIVPLEVEAEVAETNWWEKSVVEVN